jgi:type IV secretory pathway TrbL component
LLTAAQLESVSAGNALSNPGLPVINIYLEGVNVVLGNINIATQVALATASVTAFCVVCSGDAIATAFATANNLNRAAQQ